VFAVGLNYREHAQEAGAGLTVGQDTSDRRMQLAGTAPQQYCLAKSYRGFAPVGPWLVTPDEFANPDDLELSCTLNSQLMQKARTSDMIFPVPQIIVCGH
jgi:2-keto-4-pentenoate hydratase/2-oxohepta-3-ene-1,7-dioic acid hydratase in catechol pathway